MSVTEHRLNGSSLGTVAIFENAPELLDAIDPAAAAELSLLQVPQLSLERGAWVPRAQTGRSRRVTALVVVEGILLRRVTVTGRSGAELLGAGDVLQPWVAQPPRETLSAEVSWEVLEQSRLAVLDETFFTAAARRWPAIASALITRGTERTHMLAFQHAASHAPGLDVRLGALLWSLADRWGRVTPEGVLVPIRLTHLNLSELVGASRPSVSTALKSLEGFGAVERRPDGWLLRGRAPAAQPAWTAAA